MIDLHMHTTYSDGTWDTKKILKECEKAGISTISITDHNTVKAHYEISNMDNVKKYYTGRIILGCEFDIMFHGAKLELLGYNFDLDKMNSYIDKYYTPFKCDLMMEFNHLYNQCKKHNIKIDDLDYNPCSGNYPIYTIYNSIKKYGENKKFFTDSEWNNVDMLFRSCTCNPDFPLYLDFSYIIPSAKIISDAIRNSGGKVFVAHIFSYNLNEPLKYLDYFRKENIIDGVEVCHSYFTSEQMDYLKAYCKKYNLLMCGGSDCHGDRKKDKKVGIGYGNLNIPESLVSNWL